MVVLKKILSLREMSWWKGIIKAQEIILFIGCTVMMLMLVAETLARYIFHYDFAGYEDIVLITSMWVYMLGGAYQTRREKLISADMTNLFLKTDRQKKRVRLFSGTIAFLASIFLLNRGYAYAVWAFKQRATTPTLSIPLKFVQLSMFVGYAFIVFYNAFILIERFAAVFGRDSSGEGGLTS